MNFGLMMIWNWIVGLVLFFPVVGFVYWILEKKYGKDVMDFLDGNNADFDMQCLFAAAIVTLLWEAALPILIYLLVLRVRSAYEIMHK